MKTSGNLRIRRELDTIVICIDCSVDGDAEALIKHILKRAREGKIEIEFDTDGCEIREF